MQTHDSGSVQAMRLNRVYEITSTKKVLIAPGRIQEYRLEGAIWRARSASL